MDKIELKKNSLDLKYQFQIQKINASLTMMTIGVLAFIGSFIWYLNRLMFGIAIALIIILISLIFYNNTKKEIKRITDEIENLK